MRIDNRCPEQMRPVTMEMGFQKNAGGSCLISVGNTRVLCAASVSMSVPPFLTNTGKGWLTAEYGMLPGSTGTRKRRPGASNDGRSVEIQRLIGRSLRAIVDLKKLDGLTIQIDCDVLDADGGTRTASITGAWCALKMLV
ncbi:MAG: ribonuclease PH, partial [Clostridia bacterium]|nr:ribonuclease PH [Clostridia bacterium]